MRFVKEDWTGRNKVGAYKRLSNTSKLRVIGHENCFLYSLKDYKVGAVAIDDDVVLLLILYTESFTLH